MAAAVPDGKPSPAAAVPDGKPSPAAAGDADVERPSAAGSDSVVTTVVRRWRREDLQERSALLLRALACAFSLLSLVVMASNKHGDWQNFDNYEEYRYLVAIGVLGFLYTLAQLLRHGHRLSTGIDLMPRSASGLVDFAGDQVMAYLLISASSAAIPTTNHMREGADNLFTDASAASISMAFFAFIALALAALISGFKLSKLSYI